ncbi:MAG: VPLPA-CTERM sorting domain-containing protein [Pseudomonadota bacterium]
MKLKTLAAAAAFLGMAAPMAANATLVVGDSTVAASQVGGGGAFSASLKDEAVLQHGIFTAEAELGTTDSNGTLVFEMTANSSVIAVESNTVNTAGDISGLIIKLLVDGTEVASQSGVVGSAIFAPITVVAGQIFRIEASWDQVFANGTNLDFRVDATPLPAGVALFLTGLAGLGVARKRKSA